MNEEAEKIIESWANVMDVKIPLQIELGRTRMKLGEILSLKENAIVQLSRSTGEGVDIRSGEKRLLRGEIIVLEDRSGIRISEIVAPQN